MAADTFSSPKELLAVLRQRMKLLKYTYADAAKALGVSLPTMKRFFTSEDVSLGKVLALAEWLGLTLHDLAELAQQSAADKHIFSAEQDKFLARNPGHIAYLFALVQGAEPSEIAAKHNLSSYSTQRYLNELEKIGLIRQSNEGKVKVLMEGSMSWEEDSELGKTHSKRMLLELSERVGAKLAQNSPDSFLILRGVMLMPETFANLKRDLDELVAKYDVVSDQTRRLKGSNAFPRQTFAIIADHWEYNVFRHIPNFPK